MSSTEQARRRYNSDGRRAQARATRERILETARRLFVAHGFAGTSIARIAEEAGVSAPTVFAGFRTKVNLLKEAAETTLVGDADSSPLHERPQMRYVHDGETAEEVLLRLAAFITEVAPRAYPIFGVVLAAADSDPEIARLVRTIDEQRLAGATLLATSVMQRLREDDPERLAEIRDTIWTFNSYQLYDLLVLQRGWSARRFGDWIGRALTALLV